MQYRNGFTLIELSMVILIVSLVISGAFVGKNMMAAAEIRTVIGEYDMYTKAVREFSDKYQALPGDFGNSAATGNWGTDTTAGTCPNITNYTTLRRETCDGNADGTIGNWLNETASNDYEWFRAWQHLANAGLIEGQFTGVKASATAGTTAIGTNVPRSKIGRASGWTLMYMATSVNDNFYFAPTASHTLIFGAQTTSSFTDAAVLTPIETKNIDDKMDDGMPYTGNLRVKRANGNSCAIGTASTDAYRLTADTNACQLLFLMGL